ncbi:hypothetical protein AB3N59_19275 [Leptospira sp. WS92.C1]
MTKLVLLLLSFSLFFVLGGCAQLQTIQGKIKTPEIYFERVEIAEITLEDMKLLIQTEVKNSYSIALPASKLDLNVKIEDTQFSKLKLNLESISASSKKTLPIEVKLRYSVLNAGLDALDISIDTEFELVLNHKAESDLQFQNLNFELYLENDTFLTDLP